MTDQLSLDDRPIKSMVIIGEVGVLLFVVLLYVVPTELTEYTEAYGLKLFESTEWPTLREARIHRNDCLRRLRRRLSTAH